MLTRDEWNNKNEEDKLDWLFETLNNLARFSNDLSVKVAAQHDRLVGLEQNARKNPPEI